MKTQNTQKATFNIQDMQAVALIMVVTGILIAFGLDVLSDIKTDFVTGTTQCGLNSSGGTAGTLLYTGCGAEYNASVDTVSGVSKISSKLPLIGTVVIAAILIGILVRYLARSN